MWAYDDALGRKIDQELKVSGTYTLRTNGLFILSNQSTEIPVYSRNVVIQLKRLILAGAGGQGGLGYSYINNNATKGNDGGITVLGKNSSTILYSANGGTGGGGGESGGGIGGNGATQGGNGSQHFMVESSGGGGAGYAIEIENVIVSGSNFYLIVGAGGNNTSLNNYGYWGDAYPNWGGGYSDGGIGGEGGMYYGQNLAQPSAEDTEIAPNRITPIQNMSMVKGGAGGQGGGSGYRYTGNGNSGSWCSAPGRGADGYIKITGNIF